MSGDPDLLTFIVPTLNRSKTLACTLAFITQRFKGPVIVADSSNSELKNVNAQMIKALNAPSVHYEPWPEDAPPLDKFILACKLVKTKYAVFCADDDFIVPEAALEAVQVLESDPTVKAVNGRGVSLRLGASSKLSVTNYRQRAVRAPTWLERLNRFARPYSSNFYTVQRTEALLSMMETMAACETVTRFYELFGAFTTVIRGNIHRLDRLFVIRGTDEPDRGSAASEKFSSYLFNPDFSKEIAKFLGSLTSGIEKLYGPLDDKGRNDLKKVVSDLLTINYLCAGPDKHPICIREDESEDQLGWMKRFNDPAHPDTVLLQSVVDSYMRMYS